MVQKVSALPEVQGQLTLWRKVLRAPEQGSQRWQALLKVQLRGAQKGWAQRVGFSVRWPQVERQLALLGLWSRAGLPRA